MLQLLGTSPGRRLDKFFSALWRPVMEGELCKRGESPLSLSPPHVLVFLNELMCPSLGLAAGPAGPFPGNTA